MQRHGPSRSDRRHAPRALVRPLVGAAVLLGWLACGSNEATPIDAAAADAALADALVIDGAMLDGPALDAAAMDASAATDGPLATDGGLDAASADASPADASPPDATPPDAFVACGCGQGEYCDLGGVCQPGPGPLGGYCAETPTCNLSSPSFPNCVNDQCLSKRCGPLLPDAYLAQATCSRACDIYQDNDGNGINDPDAPMSDCQPPSVWDGPVGTTFRCVNHAAPAQSVLGYCLPGSGFESCTSNGQCASTEVCQLGTIGGAWSLHCLSRYRENSAWPGSVVRLGGACNTNSTNGPLVYCADGPCMNMSYCSAYCGSDADCDTTLFTPSQRCVSNECTNLPGAACTTDLECSIAACTGILDLGGPIFNYCEAKN